MIQQTIFTSSVLKTDMNVEGQGKAAGEKIETEYREKNYHRPSDEFDASTWTMEGAIKDLKLLFGVGRRLAFEEGWPKWKAGSEFKALREKSRS